MTMQTSSTQRSAESIIRRGRAIAGARLRWVARHAALALLAAAAVPPGASAESCIVSLEPQSGPAAGGAHVRVRLVDRLAASEAAIRFGDQVARIVGRTDAGWEVETPSHLPGVVTVRVSAEGCDAEAEMARFTFLAPPRLVGVQVAGSPADSGDLVLEAEGSGFGPDASFLVDGVPVATARLAENRLQVRIPPALLGTARVMALQIRDPERGMSDALPLTLANPPPHLSSLQTPPLRAGRGRTTIRLTGRDFRPASVVRLGSAAQETRFLSDRELEAVLPAEALARPGGLPIRVETPGPGGGESNALDLTVLPPPPFGGRFVVFMTNRDGGRNHIHLLDRQTGQLDPLPEANSAGASDGYPAISADGRVIAFQSDRHGGQSDILLFDREARTLDLLPEANDPKAFDGFPSVSPDGRFIVFESDRIRRRPKIFVFDRETRLLSELSQANDAAADDGVAAISN